MRLLACCAVRVRKIVTPVEIPLGMRKGGIIDTVRYVMTELVLPGCVSILGHRWLFDLDLVTHMFCSQVFSAMHFRN